jgi:hypothetical protein
LTGPTRRRPLGPTPHDTEAIPAGARRQIVRHIERGRRLPEKVTAVNRSRFCVVTVDHRSFVRGPRLDDAGQSPTTRASLSSPVRLRR